MDQVVSKVSQHTLTFITICLFLVIRVIQSWRESTTLVAETREVNFKISYDTLSLSLLMAKWCMESSSSSRVKDHHLRHDLATL